MTFREQFILTSLAEILGSKGAIDVCSHPHYFLVLSIPAMHTECQLSSARRKKIFHQDGKQVSSGKCQIPFFLLRNVSYVFNKSQP